MIQKVNEHNLEDAARIHSETWKFAHRGLCSEEFLMLHTPEHQREFLKKIIADGSELYLLYLDGQPVGMVSVLYNVISNLYVLPSMHHRGCGLQLLSFAVKRCVRHPHLWVLSSNRAALRLYGKFGFRPSGREEPLIGGVSEIEMVYCA